MKQSGLLAIILFCFHRTEALSDNEGSIESFDQFLMACSKGDMEIVETTLQDHPDFVRGQSRNGESCLHVAGILGQANVTRYILEHGGNPNQRSTYEHGLRMTPLSWNVYGRHVQNIQLLLEAGADVNLDFDYMDDGKKVVITALDLLYIIESFHDDDANAADSDGSKSNGEDRAHYSVRDLLLQYGAKRHRDIFHDSEL